jgi:hypothetical protein
LRWDKTGGILCSASAPKCPGLVGEKRPPGGRWREFDRFRDEKPAVVKRGFLRSPSAFECCTAEVILKIATTAGSADVVGIKPGMLLKAAPQAAKAHNANWDALPFSMNSYEVLPQTVMTLLSALSGI